MKQHFVFLVAAICIMTASAFAQDEPVSVAGIPATDVAFWSNYWTHPRPIIFGPEQEAFYQNMQEIKFPWDDHGDPVNPAAIDANVQYLLAHPNVRFFISGYASSRGTLIYNLVLSRNRAETVKRLVISKGIPESRIAMAVGWGQVYPVCVDLNDDCWAKNRIVRFEYSAD